MSEGNASDKLQLNIEAKNVCKTYGNTAILNDFSVSVFSGEVVGLVGDNGSGKSTIMRIIALVDGLDSGDILINGEKARNRLKFYRSKIGYIPQSNALIEDMTAIDNLKLFSTADKKETQRKINELSKAFDMDDFLNKKVKHLSGGMKRRVNIAAGIVNSPRFIVADEPFAGLDATQREKVIDYLIRLSKDGVGQLITSHYAQNIKPWAKSIINLK